MREMFLLRIKEVSFLLLEKMAAAEWSAVRHADTELSWANCYESRSYCSSILNCVRKSVNAREFHISIKAPRLKRSQDLEQPSLRYCYL